MPLEVQPKLLRILQEKAYYRVGSDKAQEADFRLITSTNRTPFEAIQDGFLREDLYYRINTIEIMIPPLRERMEDVSMLAEHFLHVYADKYKRKELEFSQSAYDQMLNYHWRGNVRELQHVIERAVLLSKNRKIERLDIPRSSAVAVAAGAQSESAAVQPVSSFVPSVETDLPFSASEIPLQQNGNSKELFEEIGKLIVDRLPDPEEGTEQKDVFNELENGVVTAALRRTKGNKQAAANLLGLYRPRLYGMIKRHNIEERADT
jgi:transcriptional regulator with PAS, ATPase and Fis domain